MALRSNFPETLRGMPNTIKIHYLLALCEKRISATFKKQTFKGIKLKISRYAEETLKRD